MKNVWIRALLLALCVCLLMPALILFGALDIDAAPGDEKRFIFSSLMGADGSYPATAQSPVTLPLTEEGGTFRATTVTPIGDGATNALYISLINRSNATKLTVTYQYTENNVPYDSEPISQALVANREEAQAFVLHTPHISDRTETLTLAFTAEGELEGELILQSVYDVSVYANTEGEELEESKVYATVTTCLYDMENNSIRVEGELTDAAAGRYAGETLALFALGPGEELYLSNQTQVAGMGVSFRFSFHIPVSSAEILFSRFVVAVMRKSGERIPLCTPVYPSIPANAEAQPGGFKGFHTSSLFAVTDSGADMEIVDVYLNKMAGDRNNGILYAGEHQYFYFDTAYVNELDRRIRNLSGAGCTVYLRFLISPDANPDAAKNFQFLIHTEEAADAVNKGIVINSEKALLEMHAYTDFLTDRYHEGKNGSINGIILGRRADMAADYGYVGNMGLSEYAELYATALHLISGTARLNIPHIRMIVPISDRTWPETVRPENLHGEYFSELFLLSLLEALSAATMHPPAFTVMLESDATPDRLTEGEGKTYGIDRLESFVAMLRQYAGFYDFLRSTLLYSWTPDVTLGGNELAAAYTLQYLTLFFSDSVESFAVDLSLPESGGYSRLAKDLQYLVTHIDTEDHRRVTASVLHTLEAESFGELIPRYDSAALARKRILRPTLQSGGYAGGQAPTGSYALFHFAGATGALGWYEGNRCTTLTVLNRALTATFSPTQNGEYADIAYHFATLTDYSFAPLMRFTVGVIGEEDVPYEVQVRLLGEGMTMIASAVVSGGNIADLYLDLSDHTADLTALRAIRVLARPLGESAADYTLCLEKVTLESSVLSDQELLERVKAEQNKDEAEPEPEKKDLTTPILVTVLVAVVSVAIAAIMIVRHRRHMEHKAGAEAVRKTAAPTNEKPKPPAETKDGKPQKEQDKEEKKP